MPLQQRQAQRNSIGNGGQARKDQETMHQEVVPSENSVGECIACQQRDRRRQEGCSCGNKYAGNEFLPEKSLLCLYFEIVFQGGRLTPRGRRDIVIRLQV